MFIFPSYLSITERRHCCEKKHSALLFFFFLFFSVNIFGQDRNDYDELSVFFSVPRLGNTEVSALIKDEEAWISVKDVFDFLKIKNILTSDLDSLSGFLKDPKDTYLIDKKNGSIQYGGNVFDLALSDLVQTETGLYLKTSVLLKVFGLDCQFNYRNLSFSLKSNIELPVIREMQQEEMRKNISQLKGEKKADTVLKRSSSFLHLGTADWSLTATQRIGNSNYLRAGLALGATVAGGEAIVNLNYYGGQSFEPGRQIFRWRYVNNSFSVFKQVSIGQIITPTVSTIFAPLNGVQITNTPSGYRRSFGTYRYTGNTEPEWMVELYVNNILIDYVKADASGFFSFEIPIVYGNSAIKLKFYGPWGQEHSREENISIPFNFLPEKKLEYTLTAGVVRDGLHSRFFRGVINYGLSKRITLGAGAEYLSSAMKGKLMPFMNASVRLDDGIILNGEYTQNVRSKASLNYRLASNMQLDLSYTKYAKNQTAIRYNYLEEHKASLTVPIHVKGIKALSRFTYNKYILPKLRYSNAEFLLSSVIARVNTNLRVYAQFTSLSKLNISSNLSLSFWLPHGVRFSPQAQYMYDKGSFGLLKAEAEKRISDKGFLNISYENNRLLQNRSILLGLRYDFGFARTSVSMNRGNKINSITQSANGSLIYENKAHYVEAMNQASVGRGGFLISTFLDLNCNGTRDAKEPEINGLRLKVNGGKVRHTKNGKLVITGLEAYSSYLIELDKNSFDNIAWQIKKPTIRVTVEPNRLRLVEVPVAVVGEVSGMVYLNAQGQQKGLSRILVHFYDSNNKLIAKTLTESDGYFSFLGLAPGHYRAQIDTEQLDVLKMESAPSSFSFTIKSSEEGSLVDGLEFILHPIKENHGIK